MFLTIRIKSNMKSKATIQAGSRLTGCLLILMLSAMLLAPFANADASEQQAIREANFAAADADGDGALTPTEFKAFIDANADDNLGQAATLRRFGAYDRAFKKLDKDESTVTWSEVMDGLAAAK
jgi:Ca2+-binding EF-hand superfamily protein